MAVAATHGGATVKIEDDETILEYIRLDEMERELAEISRDTEEGRKRWERKKKHIKAQSDLVLRKYDELIAKEKEMMKADEGNRKRKHQST
ncbi:hypothetical protein JX265_005571 [Neoarthrinium moseri]|uniref:Uncharacterized protein n=1 Tax=Neoarthrinium moseri TaxID=1658444 RepID=A0A9Q0AQ96_9PEZI|nr:hypothetical protein JX266_006595 [Neoarthrinium moseri]KAI1872691.1 hypothetical protein JX265_005571 [Neoarthrinium moseri]